MTYIPKGEWRRRHVSALAGGRAPRGWLELDTGDGPRAKVTLRLPDWVVGHFRDLGPGYQRRIGMVLAAWVAGQKGDVRTPPLDLDPDYRAEVLAKVRADMAEEKRAAEEQRESAEVQDELALAEMGINYYRRRAKVHAMLDEEAERRELERWGPEGRPG